MTERQIDDLKSMIAIAGLTVNAWPHLAQLIHACIFCSPSCAICQATGNNN